MENCLIHDDEKKVKLNINNRQKYNKYILIALVKH